MSSAPRSASSLQKSQSSRTPPEHYADSVFLNCPFDSDYIPIFDAVVFAIFSCGFIARSALEITDSSEVRIDKICRIISNSKLAVHDLCRTELDADSNLPRFNMPLELGIFLGAKKLGTKIQREKSCLMLDREAFRYQKFISDIAGQDIRAHSGQPEQAVTQIGDWLASTTGRKTIPGGAATWQRYQRFQAQLPAICENAELLPIEMTFNVALTLSKLGWSKWALRGPGIQAAINPRLSLCSPPYSPGSRNISIRS